MCVTDKHFPFTFTVFCISIHPALEYLHISVLQPGTEVGLIGIIQHDFTQIARNNEVCIY